MEKYDGMMDEHCIRICDKLNTLPGVETIESCEGHGKHAFNVWFDCTDINSLNFIMFMFSKRYSSYGQNWNVMLADSDNRNPKIMNFLLTSIGNYGHVTLGEEAYKQIDTFCDEFDKLLQWYNSTK